LLDACLTPVASRPAVSRVDFVNAAIWLVSRKCLLDVGGFDPLFFHRGEDSDYVCRARFHGYDTGVCLNAFATHARPQEAPALSYRAEGEGLANCLLVRLKDPGRATRSPDRVGVCLSLLASVVSYFARREHLRRPVYGLRAWIEASRVVLREHEQLGRSFAACRMRGPTFLSLKEQLRQAP
jgi:hypothetical protein